jgi:hypothetical protein
LRQGSQWDEYYRRSGKKRKGALSHTLETPQLEFKKGVLTQAVHPFEQ